MANKKIVRVAINGFGRIGRLFFRQFFGTKGFEIVGINDLGDLENLAYLLKYDSVYRGYGKDVGCRMSDVGRGQLFVDETEIAFIAEKDPTKLPWKAWDVDVVVEATGAFESFEKASAHITAGAKRVVIAAPAKDDEGVAGGRTVLAGINEELLATCQISSNGSCTTNAAAPVAAILHEAIGIAKGFLSTAHAYTATQNLVDGATKGKDFRRGRAGACNVVPSTTGAAISVTRGIPELAGKFDGIALRLPIPTGSLVDFTFLMKRKTTPEEINEVLRAASLTPRWQGIVRVSDEQMVSSDVVGDTTPSVVDSQYTKVVDGDLVKVLVWYDNEWGYVPTLIRQVKKSAEFIS